MAYEKGSGILAADYNTFAGLTATGAADAATAQNKAGYLYGVGFGNRGYGQTTPALTALSIGGSVAQEWQSLRTVMANLANWQNTSTTLLPPSSSFNAAAPIVAHESSSPSLNSYDIQDLLATLDTNRLNYQAANMLLSTLQTSTRSTAWGNGSAIGYSTPDAGIEAQFQVDFASEDEARYFFNTGGEFRITLAHANTSSPRNSSWNTVLNSFVLAFRANTSARISGSYGTATSVGYYGLTTTYQTICDGLNSGTGAYTVNDFIISARALTLPGVRGAKGATIQFKVTLLDEQTNAFSDTVASGTASSLQQYKANAVFTVASPTSTSIIKAF